MAKLKVTEISGRVNTGKLPQLASLNIPLNRWGGSFGTHPLHDLKTGFYKGDNISEFNGGVGLSLNIDVYQDDGGLYQMDAKIIPTSE